MANNPYVNKVQFGNQTIIDITPTTAQESDVAEGKYFFKASGELTLGTLSGGGGTAIIKDTTDSAGGTIREITTDEELYLTSLSATQNQTYTAPSGTAYDEVVVNVSASPNLQAKTNISPTTSSQTVTADNGYDGLSSVQINAMPTMTLPTSASASATTGYTSKATISRSTSDQYINIPTGYNSAGAYYKVNATENMALPTSTSASATSGYTSKATVSRSTSDQYINIPTGYNASGAYYKINATPNGTVTAPSTITGSSATVSTGTNTLTLSKTVSVTPTVSTAGYVSSGTAGNSNVSLTASVTTKGATTITPSTTQQTAVSSGTYVTGNVVVSAMPTMTLPSAPDSTSSGTSKGTITRSTSTRYLNIPTGYNSTAQYYTISAVADGTEGTPTATKGTVSNHSISVTPSVTNSAGYITGSTKTGTAVTVTASELASGNKEITENGTNIDVVGYSTVSVDVASGASNIVTGTFTTVATEGTSQTVTVPYSGDGYVVSGLIYVSGGIYNSSNTAWYDAIRNNSIGMLSFTKNDMSTSPDYLTTGTRNSGYCTATYKNSTSSATSYGALCGSYSVYKGQATASVNVTIPSKTTFRVYVSASGTRGFMPDLEYTYILCYSS